MTDFRLALMCGTDIPIKSLQATVHQPKIKEIALMGESDFFIAISCLNISKSLLSQDKKLLETTNNFQIFMTIMQEKEAKEKKMAVQNLLQLIFPKYTILFTPRAISLTFNGETKTLDESNFEDFQEVEKNL